MFTIGAHLDGIMSAQTYALRVSLDVLIVITYRALPTTPIARGMNIRPVIPAV